jgi:hypothetical protein
MDKSRIEGLLYYFKASAELDPGIQTEIIEVLEEVIEKINAEEAAAKRKRKSPNKSGVVQLDPETYAIVAEYATQKEALAALGKEGKSGIGDALNGRTKTHVAYGLAWCFKDELDAFLASKEQ